MFSRQLVKQFAKAASAKPFFASQRFSHDAHFPAKVHQVHYHEAVNYLGADAPYPHFEFPTNLHKYGAERARILYESIPQAREFYKTLTTDEDKQLFVNMILAISSSTALVEKITGKSYLSHFEGIEISDKDREEALLFKYNISREAPPFFHGGIFEVLLQPFIKRSFIGMIAAITMVGSTVYMSLITVYAIRAYFDGLIYDHHDEHAEHH